MVNPMILIAMFLFTAFIIALADKLHRTVSLALMFTGLITALAFSVYQFVTLYLNPGLSVDIVSAGFPAPLSIVLRFGLNESLLLSLLNLMGLFGGIYLISEIKKGGAQAIALYMLVLLGANGLVLTRDIFNSFVFLEILSIATYSILGIYQDKNSLASGLKYMFAGGISSSLYLLGIVMAYRYTGTLNIDTWISLPVASSPGYIVAMFLVGIGLFLELKPFPANGWALDLYQASDSGLGAIISSVNTGALLYLYSKIMPVFDPTMLALFTGAGLVSFVFANLVGIRQHDVKRLLGYSSTAQAGLVVFTLGSLRLLGVPDHTALVIAFGFFVTNALAKAGLFWLTGIVNEKLMESWGVIRKNSGLFVMLMIFGMALMSVPPFPGFYAKWEMIKIFSAHGAWIWIAALLLGSLFEAAYLLRLIGWAARGETDKEITPSVAKVLGVMGVAIALSAFSFYLTVEYPGLSLNAILPAMALLLMGLIDFFPTKVKGFVAILLLSGWAYYMLVPALTGIKLLFGAILVGGSILQIFGFMNRKGRSEGIFPTLTMLIVAMGTILLAKTKLEFFMGWEYMTFASFFMILRGQKARLHAYAYALFSTFAAYLILTGLNILPTVDMSGLVNPALITEPLTRVALLLLAIGFLIKMGSFTVHYWLPGAYAESEDDTTSILSSVLSKVGVYGLMMVLTLLAGVIGANDVSMNVLGWLGILTAFFGALMAVFQEDAKYLLAYSSMSQLGYIVAGFSLMSHLGWVSALYLSVNHFLFKGLIFMAMAGVFYRTGTRNMYEMGGLIKKMPISYISVLLGIIAASGVPPLTGFGSKWFIYTSLLEQGRYLQAALAFFSSAIAFLYLYKLIHTVFLGQAKPNQSAVKEAPIWLIIPQVVFMMVIMAFSCFPNMITKPLSEMVGAIIAKPEWLSWNGYNMVLASPAVHGNWNGNLIMYVTMGVFIFPLSWLLLVNARTQKVKQFNIVFAAERPYKPWTTHFAYNMFAPYRKALGLLVEPRATAFYKGIAEWTHSLSATISRLYTGNGQTYLLHLFLYTIVLYAILGVK